MTKKPDEKDIERLLSNIQPEPGEDFKKRMENAPWNQPDVINLSASKGRHRLRAAAAGIITLLFAAILFAPSGQAMAKFLSAFFSIAPEETREYSFVVPEPTATIPQELLQATIEAYHLPVETLQASASVEIKLPQYLPEGYVYDSGYTDEDGNVFITYLFAEGDRIRRFLNIRQVNDVPHGFEVGANAIIQDVTINAVVGEYLQGGWDTEEYEEVDGTVNMTTRWNNDIEMHFISWYDDAVLYEIFYQASLYVWSDGGIPDEPGYLTLDELLAVAESLE